MLLNILCVALNKQYHADHLCHKAMDINKIRNSANCLSYVSLNDTHTRVFLSLLTNLMCPKLKLNILRGK
jgi:hypothetical protein